MGADTQGTRSMRYTLSLACGLLAACGSSGGGGGGGIDVLSSFEEGTPSAVRDTFDDIAGASDGAPGYVTFGLRLNDIRLDAGVGAVTENATLNQIAQGHAEDQVANNYFAHLDRTGGTAGDRALAGGYDYRYIAENIARGFNDEDAVIDAWMASPGHVENMLDVRAEEFGVGREDTTWVLLLGSEFDSEAGSDS